MEGLEDQIDKLSTLLAALEIPDETEKIVLDYSSDENPYDNPFLVKGEDGDSSNNKPHKKRTYEIYTGRSDYESEMYRHRYIPKGSKWRKVPYEYIPKFDTYTMRSPGILNLDYENNPYRTLEDWKNRTGLLIQTNKELLELKPEELLNFLEYKTSGIVYNYLVKLTPQEKSK